MDHVPILALFAFAPIVDPAAAADRLRETCVAAGVRGKILLGEEGVNAMLAGPEAGLATARAAMRDVVAGARVVERLADPGGPPFVRLIVRVKPEIVPLGEPATGAPGTRVAPADWDDVLADPGTVVIDTRNRYETAIGTFDGALDPGLDRFRDFPAWWAGAAQTLAGRRVAMFCTGGIRCEKASRWLTARGVGEVLQLDGGILGYLADIPQAQSRWQGACFVFDGRVAVGHGLVPTGHGLCIACGHPVAPPAPCQGCGAVPQAVRSPSGRSRTGRCTSAEKAPTAIPTHQTAS